MISVSDALKEAFINKEDLRLVITVSDGTTLDNDDFMSGTMSLEQSVCTEESITFGSFGSACFSIQLVNTGKKYKGLVIRPILYAGTNYSVPLGKFTVAEEVKSDDNRWRDIKAYDDLYFNYDKDVSSWYSQLTYPITIKNMRDSLFSYVGITQESVDLVNDSITVNRTIDVTENRLTFKEMLFYICEINCALGCITQNDHFRYITPDIFNDGLFPHDDLYPADDLYPRDLNYEYITQAGENSLIQVNGYIYKDYNVERCTAVTIKEDSADYGTTYGDGDNVYVIVGNILCMGNDSIKNSHIAENIYSIANGVYYNPTDVTLAVAMPWIECGDYAHVSGLTQSGVFPILERKLTGVSNMYDQYIANGTEYYPEETNNVNSQIIQLRSKTLKLTATIDGVSSELTDEIIRATGVEESLNSLISQTATSIKLTVSKSQKEWDINPYTFDESALYTYRIRLSGYSDPTTEGYDASEYSEYLYLNQTNGYIYESTGATWVVVKRCETIQTSLKSEISQTASEIKSTVSASQREWEVGDYSISVYGYSHPATEGVDPSTYSGRYYLNQTNGFIYSSDGSEWTFAYACSSIQSTLQSQITQNANQISLKVSTTSYTHAEIVAKINDSTSSVLISADKINLSGYATFSSLSTAGSTTINGSNITTGTISANRIDVDSLTVKKLDTQNGIHIEGNYIEFRQWINALRMVYKLNDTTYTATGIQFENAYSQGIRTKLLDGQIYKATNESLIYVATRTQFSAGLTSSTTIGAAGNIETGANITADGTVTGAYINSKNAVRVNFTSSTYGNIGYDASAGNFNFSNETSWANIAASSFINASSRVVKENIEDISDEDAKKLLDIRPVNFDYKRSGLHSHGMIAEEVYEIYPDLVMIPKDWNEENYTEETISVPSLDYSKFVPYLIKMVQIQQQEINALKGE